MSIVKVEQYNPDWKNWFESLNERIFPAVKEWATSVEHVGSTSVPGLAAKPVIDIDIVIDKVEHLNPVIRALEHLGYVHRGNLGIEEREAFKIPVTSSIKHNLYVCTKNCSALRNHLILRDHIRKSSESRNQYGDLKLRLADTSITIDEYVEGKTSFIISVLKQWMSPSELEAITNSNRASNKKLIVKSANQEAELWDKNQLVKIYKISTALNGLGCEDGSYCTPTGRLKVASKIGNGLPIGGVLRSRVPTNEIWSSDSNNLLSASSEDLVLTRLLWLEGAEKHNSNTFKRFIYLHGTNQEHLLGTPASHGCIRFSNGDILEIFDSLQAGNEVEIL